MRSGRTAHRRGWHRRPAVASLRTQPWVTDIREVPGVESLTLTVRVSDEDVARDRLLRLVLGHEDVQVVEFGRRRSELEDVFINVVEGGVR